MASYQYVYHMDGVSKTYPGGKKVFENIRLNFLPGVKIGVVGVNGAGKSTLLRVMAGWDKDFQGEAWAAKGAKVGYLPQEPKLDETLSVRENVKLGVAEKQAKLDRYNELAMNYSDETAEEMAQLQDVIDAENLWELDNQIDIAMEALRDEPFGRREAPCRALQAASGATRIAAPRRAYQPPRRRNRELAGKPPQRISRRDPDHHPRPLLSRSRRRLDPRTRSRQVLPL